ncbi:MAG: SprT-like domain-containing protein [Pseudomonadota bacterium]|nr:SprT-like domain-containing protein [Pseudomonadota bacterium]
MSNRNGSFRSIPLSGRLSFADSRQAYLDARRWLESNPDLPARIEARLVAMQNHLQQVLDKPLAAVAVEYSLRGCAAGRAGPKKISLNPVLLRENESSFLAQVVPHEYAHCAVMQLWPRAAPHGRHWKMVMELLGAPARRCHPFDTRNVRQRRLRRYRYRCGCGPVELTSIRHHRIERGAAYDCRRCGQRLTPA